MGGRGRDDRAVGAGDDRLCARLLPELTATIIVSINLELQASRLVTLPSGKKKCDTRLIDLPGMVPTQETRTIMSLPTFEQRLDAYCTWAEKEYGTVYFHDNSGSGPSPVEFYDLVDDNDENIVFAPCFDKEDIEDELSDRFFDVRIIRPGSDEFSDLLFFYPDDPDLEPVIAFARKRRLKGREYLANRIEELKAEEYVLEWFAI
jgi:hypothetical protein